MATKFCKHCKLEISKMFDAQYVIAYIVAQM
jgi:hypothetical protein